MSQCEITENLGAGKYKAKRIKNLDRAEYYSAELAQKISDIDTQLSNPDLDNFLRALLLNQKATYTNQKAIIDAEIAKANNVINIWCIDYTDNLQIGDIVGVCDIPGEMRYTNIQPGWNGNAIYNKVRDGRLQPAVSAETWNHFLNACLMPGVRKWRPTYRYATITEIDKINDFAKITLQSSVSRYLFGDHNINPTNPDMANIPVNYMDCNAEVFEVGDTVVVFFNYDWETPVIRGFKDNPKECCTCTGYAFDNPPAYLAQDAVSAINVSEGCKPYNWSVSGIVWDYQGGTIEWSLAQAQTQDGSNIVTAGCGDAVISVTDDKCGTIQHTITGDTCPCDPVDDCANFAFDTSKNPTTITEGEQAVIYIIGGCPPFSWSISGVNWSLQQSTTDDRMNIVTAGCGTGIITVNDAVCGTIGGDIEGGFRSSTGIWSDPVSGCVLTGDGSPSFYNGGYFPRARYWKMTKTSGGYQQNHYYQIASSNVGCPECGNTTNSNCRFSYNITADPPNMGDYDQMFIDTLCQSDEFLSFPAEACDECLTGFRLSKLYSWYLYDLPDFDSDRVSTVCSCEDGYYYSQFDLEWKLIQYCIKTIAPELDYQGNPWTSSAISYNTWSVEEGTCGT